jgi:hypothetical protein
MKNIVSVYQQLYSKLEEIDQQFKVYIKTKTIEIGK